MKFLGNRGPAIKYLFGSINTKKAHNQHSKIHSKMMAFFRGKYFLEVKSLVESSLLVAKSPVVRYLLDAKSLVVKSAVVVKN